MQETRSLALVLSGAVSLGSFEAGVLDELLYGLEQLARNGGPRYRIDVITGASAGSMTAALVARYLMHDMAHRSALHDAWVDAIDIRALTSRIPPAALLDSSPVDVIAERYLMSAPFTPGERPLAGPDVLQLSFTLSNMNGIDFTLPCTIPQAHAFTSTFHAERRRYALDAATSADSELWDRIRQAALCSGSFPLAFLPRMMAGDLAAVAGMTGTLAGEYCYVDGGMFNKEPIKEAVLLAADADGGAVAPSRKFLMVDATVNRSTADPSFNADAPFGAVLRRVVGAVMGERGANDWLRAQRTNNEIGWRDAFVLHLADLVRRNDVADPAALEAGLDDAIATVVTDKCGVNPSRWERPDAVVDAFAEVRREHASLFIGLTDGRARVLERMLFLVNNIAGLQRKAHLDLDVIYAEPGETAGDRLYSFGGFFNREWREFDYRVGRRKARALMPQVFRYDAALVPPESRADGTDVYAPNGDYSAVTMKDADPAQRRMLRDAIAHKIALLARENSPGPRFLLGPLTAWLASGVARNRVSQMLEL